MLSQHEYRAQRGFTYLELLFVIVILSIVSLMGVSSYSGFNARKQTEAETKKVVEYVQIAQEKTRASDIPSSCGSYAGFYTVNLTGSTLSFGPSGCSNLATHNTGDFVYSEGDFQVGFNQQGTAATGDSCILVEHPRADYCGKVTIESSGIVKDEILTTSSCSCP